ncbi:hypothetical protein DH2020_007370 [Rehmannia glutinosa]|uniref:Enoyl reductase (ER) domain-containing protein n=1 Tax=Rehmannia glutinosa TaxID=99300 RepID=A0ABR0TXZ7_REHGL
MEKTVKANGWGARDTSGLLSPLEFSRRPLGLRSLPDDTGHEIVGVVTEVGSKVQKVKVGDNVGVGVIVDACRKCDQCVNDLENYCPERIDTYNGVLPDGSLTYGVIPILCPLRYYGLDKPGLHVGVAGLGGLGHVAVKFLKAFGTKVTVLDISPDKKSYAIDTLGADGFILSNKPAEMEAAAGTLDGILDCVSVFHSLQGLLDLLKPHGKLVVVGLPEKPLELPIFSLTMGRKMMGGSMIGGLKETQEMIDFAAKHNILPEVEIISMDYVNTAMERLARGDVKFRFVIDVGKTLKAV